MHSPEAPTAASAHARASRIAIAALALVGLVACGGGGGGGGGPTAPLATTGPVLVSDTGAGARLLGGDVIQQSASRNVAIDRAGRIHAIWRDATGLRHSRSVDGGASFLPSVLVVDAATAPEPRATIACGLDHANDVFIAYVGADSAVRCLRSSDGGATWPVAGVDTGLLSSSFNGLTVAAASEIVLVTVASGAKTARSTDRGATFEAPTLTPLSSAVFSNVLVDPRDASTFVVLSDDAAVRATVSSDGGATWTPEVGPTAATLPFSNFAIGGQGLVFGVGDGPNLVIFDADLATLTPAPGVLATFANHRVAVDGNDTLHVVGVVGGVLGLETSDDDATTFTTPLALDTGVGIVRCAASPAFPGVAIVYERDGLIYYQHN